MPSRRNLVLFALALVVGLVSLTYQLIVRPASYEMVGPSMEPTLRDGDSVAVHGSTWGGILPPPDVRPGDVVVARSPADEVLVLKRVIAVGGQRVEQRAGRMWVDGRPLARDELACPDLFEPAPQQRCWEERLGEHRWTATASDFFDDDTAERIVPAGHVFLRGDRRDRSNDSTNPIFGDVPLSYVLGVSP